MFDELMICVTLEVKYSGYCEVCQYSKIQAHPRGLFLETSEF